MSWKSLVTASLLCALASPAFAAPTVEIVPGGTVANNHLNANGDWVWLVRLSQSNPRVDLTGVGTITTSGSPLAAELTFTATGSALISADENEAAFDDPNPGKDPGAGWEWLVLTDLGGTGECSSGDPGNCPVGIQINTGTGQVFSAFGSVDYLTDDNGKDYLTITTSGPEVGDLSTTLTMGGAYGGNGRIAELNQAWDPSDNMPAASLNYDTYAGAETRTARAGDADLNGAVTFEDFTQLFLAFGGAGEWQNGDFTGDDTVSFEDFTELFLTFGQTYSVGPSGAGGGGAVPEPTSAVLALLAGTMFFARRSR